jgi:hypothetical protein
VIDSTLSKRDLFGTLRISFTTPAARALELFLLPHPPPNMPVYLVHGFRWPRDGFSGIRVHAVVHALDEISVEYIQNGNSRRDLLRSLRKAYPDIMKELDHTDVENEVYVQPGLKGGIRMGERRLEFIEQYNPEDVDGPYAVSQPYAYVGDKVVVIATAPGTASNNATGKAPQTPAAEQKKPPGTSGTTSKTQALSSLGDPTALSVNMDEVIANGPGLTNKAWEALADLRDKIAEGEKIGWWVVYNGDPDRAFDDSDDEYDEEYDEQEANDIVRDGGDVSSAASPTSPISPATIYSTHRPTISESAPIPVSITGTYPVSTPPVAAILAQAQQEAAGQTRMQSPGLTALPIRPTPPSIPIQPPPTQTRPQSSSRTSFSRTRTNNSSSIAEAKAAKQKDASDDPSKVKEASKAQSLRKKFFGRKP